MLRMTFITLMEFIIGTMKTVGHKLPRVMYTGVYSIQLVFNIWNWRSCKNCICIYTTWIYHVHFTKDNPDIKRILIPFFH